jgi:hypothetical protein
MEMSVACTMDVDEPVKNVEKGAINAPIAVEHMPQQIELQAPEDDWTGITDPKQRRKLQNRMHQRLYSKFLTSPENPA